MTSNPYEPNVFPSKAGSRSRDRVGLVLCFFATLFGLLMVAGVAIEVDLILRYPGLRDDSSGPAYYWPSDMFQIVGVFCVLMFSVFAISFGLFCERRRRLRKLGIGADLFDRSIM